MSAVGDPTKHEFAVARSDLEKIHDTLVMAESFHCKRDEMNAAVHLSTARYSPLTTKLMAERERVERILES